jgi:FkbM family methyltransferase
MKQLLKRLAMPVLRSLPWSLSRELIRWQRRLIHALPAGKDVLWPYYQGDIRVLVDPSNPIELGMVTCPSYEPELGRVLPRFVQPGAWCIDVGANIGAVTLQLAKRAGPTGRVLAIEPGPPYCERLRRNLALNPSLQGRVTVLPLGVSDTPGTLQWQAAPHAPFNAHVRPDRIWNSHATDVSIEVATLDTIVRRQRWQRVDFIKVDVEGMEIQVLRGARETLRQFRPVVLFETLHGFLHEGGVDRFALISELLRSVGYAMHDLTENGVLKPVDAVALPSNTLALPAAA